MKTVINQNGAHEIYDTETARLIAGWQNMTNWTDFRYKRDRLYQTKKGNFFLHEEGGAMTDRAEVNGNSSSEGASIRAISKEEALAWCAQTNNTEAALKHFADMVKDA